MKKKNIILSLGSVVTVVAPIATVVACSPQDYSYSDADKAILAKLKSKSVLNKLELTWIGKVLGHADMDVLGDAIAGTTPEAVAQRNFVDEFEKTLKLYVANKIRIYPNYLATIRHQIAINDSSISKTVTTSGSNAWTTVKTLGWQKGIYNVTALDTAVKALDHDKIKKIFFDKQVDSTTSKVVFNPAVLNIKTDILKLMISKKYLALTKKEYLDVFKNRDASNLKGIKKLTTDTTVNYPLLLATVKAKLGYTWTINLNKAQSAQFQDPTIGYKTTEVEKKYLPGDSATKYAGIVAHLKYTDGLKTVPTSIFNFNDANLQDLKGYAGIKRVSGSSDNLGTSESAMKASTATVIGLVAEGKVIPLSDTTTEVTFIDKASGQLKITKVFMVLPHYDTAKTELAFDVVASGATTAAKDKITAAQAMDAVLTNDKSIYEDAVKYYTKRTKDPILLTIKNEKIKEELLKNPHTDFIKK